MTLRGVTMSQVSVLHTIGQILGNCGILAHVVHSSIGRIIDGLPVPSVQKVLPNVRVFQDESAANSGYAGETQRKRSCASE
jgi:hypothetical protein